MPPSLIHDRAEPVSRTIRPPPTRNLVGAAQNRRIEVAAHTMNDVEIDKLCRPRGKVDRRGTDYEEWSFIRLVKFYIEICQFLAHRR